MKKNYRTSIIVITALFGLAGGGYGAWHAWDTGLIGDNPRAPTPDARFEDLLFAWTGADAIAEGTLTHQLDARHARVLEQAYGRSFQNPNADQAAAWQLTYERLTEGLYASLLAQTHLKPYYEAIVWNHNEVTDRAFGDLSAAQALLDAARAADPLEGRTLVNAFGRLLRGLGLTRDTTYFALREHLPNGGVFYNDARKSQSLRYGEKTAANDSLWRIAA